MSSEGTFRTKDKELERLVRELDDVKTNIKNVSATLGRIERHVRMAFDIPKQPNGRGTKVRGVESTKPNARVPAISARDALAIFDDLSALFSEGKEDIANDRISQLHVPDLRVLARELGVTLRSRSSKRELCSGIIRRINERSMLSRNVNTTQPQKAMITEPPASP